MARVVPSQVVSLIDTMFPDIKKQDEGTINKVLAFGNRESPELAALIEMVEQISPELIVLSPDEFVKYSVSVSAIKNMLKTWISMGGSQGLARLPGHGDLNPVTIIPRALLKCPDEFPASEVTSLNFIQDDEFRHNLRIDITAVEKAVSEGEWKAATVLAGSVIEALLLWAIEEKAEGNQTVIDTAISTLLAQKTLKQKPRENIDEWNIETYIEVSSHLGLVEQDTATQASLVKNFRNFIHPGRVVRFGIKCDRGTAMAAVAAIEFVVRDLTK